MRWSWKIGQLAGIDLRIHATFVLLLGWVLGSYWMAGNSIRVLLVGIGFIFAVFACVVFHDMGHAVTARKFGFRTRDITLLPIGGVARLERIPDEPKHELWVAVPGPAVNALVAALLYGWPSRKDGCHSVSSLLRRPICRTFIAGKHVTHTVLLEPPGCTLSTLAVSARRLGTEGKEWSTLSTQDK